MRVAIASRIFEPEASAASFRLAALANALHESGHEVEVLTVRPPRGVAARDGEHPYRVRRFPVLRDRTGYVRGYLQYLSFDVPLFFRVLLGRRRDLIVVEPPPTTGFFVRIAAGLRRTPFAYFAADIWSDATAQTGAPSWMVKAVRGLERFALRGARTVLSVNGGVTARLAEFGVADRTATVGNGVDIGVFSVQDAPSEPVDRYAIYAGTASEWQGAGIFIDALARVRAVIPEARVVFLGHGSDWPALKRQAAELPEGAVSFVPTVPPDEAARQIGAAVVSLASIHPDSGYSFAFPTKIFASWACGTPVIYAGEGAVSEYMHSHREGAGLGEAAVFEVEAVADALERAFASPSSAESRNRLSAWAEESVSLAAVAGRAARALENAVR